MQIRIPNFLVRWGEKFGDWANVTVWRRGRIEIRRVDLLTALGGVICVVYYWLQGGWLSALASGMVYLLIVMMALWFF